jgi:Rad3-related DNA helicase
LPYPVIGNKKWIEMMRQDKLKGTNMSHFLMINEMLLNLKQWIGRLIRTSNDKGDLYILDSRVNKINIKSKVEKLIINSFREF